MIDTTYELIKFHSIYLHTNIKYNYIFGFVLQFKKSISKLQLFLHTFHHHYLGQEVKHMVLLHLLQSHFFSLSCYLKVLV